VAVADSLEALGTMDVGQTLSIAEATRQLGLGNLVTT
jgi:hypothetical protein